jgi:hypothetical protein
MFASCLRGLPILVATLCWPAPASAQEKKPVPAMKEWERDVRKRIDKDAKLKALAAKYPLVLLHSRRLYGGGGYKQSAFSFIYETSDEKAHRNDVQLLFHNGYYKTFTVNMVVGQQNLVVDLGKVDFEKYPDPRKINIEHPGLAFSNVPAAEGHVYLERVRDDAGNSFYVLFQVISVDPDLRYMAFLWRKLPGGKLVLPLNPEIGGLDIPFRSAALVSVEEKPKPALKEWRADIRDRLAKHEKLKSLAGKYPLVVMPARELYAQGGPYGETAFSFIYETSDEEKHGNDVQILFPGRHDSTFEMNMLGGQRNFGVDLGKQDFEKDPDPTSITIDHPGLTGGPMMAREGHVYLERVRDVHGNNFYVVFQVVAVDAQHRYLAFLWRKLPGGKVVKRLEKK